MFCYIYFGELRNHPKESCDSCYLYKNCTKTSIDDRDALTECTFHQFVQRVNFIYFVGEQRHTPSSAAGFLAPSTTSCSGRPADRQTRRPEERMRTTDGENAIATSWSNDVD